MEKQILLLSKNRKTENDSKIARFRLFERKRIQIQIFIDRVKRYQVQPYRKRLVKRNNLRGNWKGTTSVPLTASPTG